MEPTNSYCKPKPVTLTTFDGRQNISSLTDETNAGTWESSQSILSRSDVELKRVVEHALAKPVTRDSVVRPRDINRAKSLHSVMQGLRLKESPVLTDTLHQSIDHYRLRSVQTGLHLPSTDSLLNIIRVLNYYKNEQKLKAV